MPSDQSPFRYPLSASYYAEQMFARGIRFRDGDRLATNPRELQAMFIDSGANEVCARIGTSRHKPEHYEDDTSLDAGVRRARLAIEFGVPFNPLLFLSRHYGDLTGQPHAAFEGYPELALDAGWETLDIDQMADHLRRFTATAAAAIVDTGVEVSIWNLGNEVDIGIAGVAPRPVQMEQWDAVDGVSDWYRPPDRVDPEIGKVETTELLGWPLNERVAWLEAHVWPHEAALLAAAADGVRSVDGDAKFSTHIGLEPPEPGFAAAFFAAMRRGGYAVDQLGLSIYPTINEGSDAIFAVQKADILSLTDEFGAPVMINEFAYPAGPTDETFGDWKHALADYPSTDDGQARIFHDLVAWGLENGLAGINPWGPDFVDPIWMQMSLFRLEHGVDGDIAVARPILHAFHEATNAFRLT